jgi:hypothetical protein
MGKKFNSDIKPDLSVDKKTKKKQYSTLGKWTHTLTIN